MSVEENLFDGRYHRRKDRAGIAQDLESVYQRFKRLRERRKVNAACCRADERQMLSIAAR